eukprot:987588-Pelagomonas_calceolata.AAC.1
MPNLQAQTSQRGVHRCVGLTEALPPKCADVPGPRFVRAKDENAQEASRRVSVKKEHSNIGMQARCRSGLGHTRVWAEQYAYIR